MKTGTVKFFNNTKGFGFITEDGSGTEHFVHVSGLIDQINENDNVSYDLKEGKRGLNAVDVRFDGLFFLLLLFYQLLLLLL